MLRRANEGVVMHMHISGHGVLTILAWDHMPQGIEITSAWPGFKYLQPLDTILWVLDCRASVTLC